MKKALFIRLDRMGDLVLTLPCDSLVANNYQAHWVIPKGLEFVAASALPEKKFTSFSKGFSWSNFFSFFRFVRQIKPDVSVSFHVPWWINAALWLTRVPVRGGVLSQWHSYAFLNKGVRQKRSQSDFHEMEYNYILVEEIFGLSRDRQKWKPLTLSSTTNQKLPHSLPTKYVVIHPGMGGSALNWPTANYIDLITELSAKIPVLITGTRADEIYLSPIKKAMHDNSQVTWLDNQLNGNQLLQILANASAVIAPSTGVLHLGASLGAPSYGIFSPIKVHHANRWGPKGKNTLEFLPQVKCPSHFECLGKECKHFNCMASITAKSVAQSIRL